MARGVLTGILCSGPTGFATRRIGYSAEMTSTATRLFVAWLLIGAAIAVGRREVLLLPPYGDNMIC